MGAGRPRAELAADPGHRGSAEPGGAAAGGRRLRDRAHHRGHAAGHPRRGRLAARPAAGSWRAHPAEHGRLPHRERGQAGGQARPGGARHGLGQARGGGRRPHPAAGPGGTARRGPDAGRRRVRGAALHQRRPGPGQAARAGRLRGRHAARRPDRVRPGRAQPAQHRDDRRAGGRPGHPGRRDRDGQRRGPRDGTGLRRGPHRLGHHPRGRTRAHGHRDAAGRGGRVRRPDGRAHPAPLARPRIQSGGRPAELPA